MREIKEFNNLSSEPFHPQTSPKLYDREERAPDSIELSAMAVVLCGESILAINEMIYGKEVLSLPKGHKEEGETLVETAIRECFEETNIVVTEDDLIRELASYSYEFSTPSGKFVRKTVVPFLFVTKSEGEPMAKEERMLSVGWMNTDEFIAKCTHENVKNAVKSIQSSRLSAV